MPRASSRRQAVPTPVDGAETGSWAPEVRGLARAAALSGILFAALFVTALVLVRQGPGIAVPDRVYAAFYTVGQGNLLVTSFHPELTGDGRIHAYFCDMVRNTAA